MAANDPTDTDDIRGRLLVVFGQEFADHAQAVRAAVAAARASARALTVDEAREVFRRIHSLKGAARAVDLSLIEEVMHRAEAVLTRHPAAELSPEQSTALYTLLERTIDTAEALQILADGTDDTADAARAEAQDFSQPERCNPALMPKPASIMASRWVSASAERQPVEPEQASMSASGWSVAVTRPRASRPGRTGSGCATPGRITD